MKEKLAVIYADGGSRGNPGPAGSGAVLSVDSKPIEEMHKFLGIATNNVAEYTGLIIGLEKAVDLGFQHVEVRMDSELIVRQMMGQYRVKNPGLIPLFMKARKLADKFTEFRIVHVPRELNKHADRLANQAMDLGSS